MPIYARRVFRLSITTALALAVAYGIAMPLPFIAPLIAFMLASQPSAPINVKGLVGLIALVSITLGAGLMLIPLVIYYPLAAILIIAAGLYLCGHLLVNLGKEMVGTFLAVGFTVIPVAGTVDVSIAMAVIQALIAGISIAVVCQWIVYPWLPENNHISMPDKSTNTDSQSSWRAIRFAFIVLPPFLLTLTNPAMYLKLIMKSVLLGQQGSIVNAREAGRELLGSTVLGGFFAIVLWGLLKIEPGLMMFFSWTLLISIYFACKMYRVIATRYTPSFWLNVAFTMLILLGGAVQDSVNGDDVYQAFAARMSMFVLLTFYSWAAIYILDRAHQFMSAKSSNTEQTKRIAYAD